LSEVYFLSRLSAARRATQLPASGQFDLASSNLSDDELEDAAANFGAERGRAGWGLSEVFSDLLSKEPRRFAVNDISALQENPINQGYAPPDRPVDGTWDATWQSDFRRADRDDARLPG
jgi:hypothetical protein